MKTKEALTNERKADTISKAVNEFHNYKRVNQDMLITMSEDQIKKVKEIAKKHGVSHRVLGRIVFRDYKMFRQ